MEFIENGRTYSYSWSSNNKIQFLPFSSLFDEIFSNYQQLFIWQGLGNTHITVTRIPVQQLKEYMAESEVWGQNKIQHNGAREIKSPFGSQYFSAVSMFPCSSPLDTGFPTKNPVESPNARPKNFLYVFHRIHKICFSFLPKTLSYRFHDVPRFSFSGFQNGVVPKIA